MKRKELDHLHIIAAEHFNVSAAGAVDREFLCIEASFSRWDAIGLLWDPLGRHWVPFAPRCFLCPSLMRLGVPLGSLWLRLDHLGLPRGSFLKNL